MPRRPAPSELLAWMLVGVSVGLAAGYVAADLTAPLRATGGRPRTGRREDTPAGPALADLARRALGAEPALRDLALEVVPSTPGVVELHGWVPSRQVRARAARLVAAQPSIASVVNCLLVRGEDDDHLEPPGSAGAGS